MGITQPGGAGTNIIINDDNNGAGGHAVGQPHTFTEIAAAFPADFVALGTAFRSYRSLVNLVNGDGVGTQVTTLTEADCFIGFDAGRTYSVSAVGRSNRFTNFGTLVDGTKDSGRAGVTAMFGGATTIQGNADINGSYLRTASGNMTLAPGQTGLSYKVVNTILYAPTGAIALGISAQANVNTAYNVDITGGTAAVGAINNFGADFGERITVALNPAGTYHIRTNSIFNVTDLVFIGVGPGTGAQLRVGGAGTNIIKPTWEQGIAITDGTHSALVNEYWPYNIIVTDGAATPIAGLNFTLTDGLGATVVSTTTDATGMITYGSGATANCVKVVTYPGGVTHTYQGPWTARVNQGAGFNSSYPQRTIVFDWPSTATWLTTNVQYQDMFDIIQLVPPGGGATNWIELFI